MNKTCLTFSVSRAEADKAPVCGFDIGHVWKVVALPRSQIRSVPGAPVGVEGVTLLQDRTTPLYRLTDLLGFESGATKDTEIVVVTEHADRLTGFIVESVHALESGEFKDSVGLSTGKAFEGLLHLDSGVATVIDPRELVHPRGLH